VPQIKKLADLRLPIHLALSLHSPYDEVRDRLMPVNIKWPVSEVVGAMKDYATISLLRLQTEIIPGFFLEDAGPRKVGNIDGFQAIFTGNDNKNPVIKYMQVYVPAGRKIFVLTYTSWNSTYESGLAEASGIIDSFTPFNSQ